MGWLCIGGDMDYYVLVRSMAKRKSYRAPLDSSLGSALCQIYQVRILHYMAQDMMVITKNTLLLT